MVDCNTVPKLVFHPEHQLVLDDFLTVKKNLTFQRPA